MGEPKIDENRNKGGCLHHKPNRKHFDNSEFGISVHTGLPLEFYFVGSVINYN